ncbi:MAG TPA: helix-turn-helix domain-containing protein [Vicinamibacterales bacterium]|nr:helix-turn-helix domain-containing protein [Vicinamibacterales bacterium]
MATHLSFPSPDPASQPPAPERKANNVGELLRAARERRRLTLQQVSNETKVPLRYLEAIERNDLEALPNGLYRRAQIRAYARAIRMDPRLAIERLERDIKAAAPPPPAPQRPPRRDAVVMPRNRVVIGIAILLTAAVVGHVLGRKGPAHPTSPARNVTTMSQRRPAPVAPPATDAVVATSLRTSAPAQALPDVAPAVTLETARATSSATTPAAPAVPTAAAATATISTSPTPVMTPASPARPVGVVANQLPQASAAQPATIPLPRESGTQLIITSQPAGARVTVDGIGWGTTPLTIRYIPPGDKKVRVSQDGYTAAERVVHVEDLQQKKVSFQLTPAR